MKKILIAELSFDCLVIDDDYSGPALEDGKITVKFMEELMEFYIIQGKLHKKYAYKVIFSIVHV